MTSTARQLRQPPTIEAIERVLYFADVLDASNRLYILLDAFLIKVFPLYSVVFAYLCYGGPLLGVVLAVAREYEPLLFDVCLPCDACISGGFSGCFLGFFWLVLVFLGRVQQELQY